MTAWSPDRAPSLKADWIDTESYGARPVRKPEVLAARGDLWVRADGLELHLGVEEGFAPQRKAHPGVLVSDIDELASRLEARDWPVQWDHDFPGMRRFYTNDNNGNRLEFLQPKTDLG